MRYEEAVDTVNTDAETFISDYRKARYPRPSVTVDLTIFTVQDTVLKVLLVRREARPFQAAWALPGGFVNVGDAFEDQGEDLDTTAHRILNNSIKLCILPVIVGEC